MAFKSKTFKKTIIRIVLHTCDPLQSRKVGLGWWVSLKAGIKAKGEILFQSIKHIPSQALDFHLARIERGPDIKKMLAWHFSGTSDMAPPLCTCSCPLLFLMVALVECCPCGKLTGDAAAHFASSDPSWAIPAPACLHLTCLRTHPHTYCHTLLTVLDSSTS